jgi:hypothetical protein
MERSVFNECLHDRQLRNISSRQAPGVLLASLHPAPPAHFADDSLTFWIWLVVLVAIAVGCGIGLSLRR